MLTCLKKEYLGDSVYAEFDGCGLILTTENGYPDDPRNMIVLEEEAWNALLAYVKRIESFDQKTSVRVAPE